MKSFGPIWFFALMIAILAPDTAFGCSCMGTRSIGASMSTADAVVVAKVVRFEYHDWDNERRYPERAIFRTSRVLKGNVAEEIPVSGANMCYQSLPIDYMRVGRSYLLPLYRIEPKTAPEGIVSLDPAYGLSPTDPPLYILDECAESALLVERGNLFTADLIPGGAREWQHYSSLKTLDMFASFGFWDVRMIRNLAFGLLAAVVAGVAIGRLRPRDRLRWVAILLTWGTLAVVATWLISGFRFQPEWFRIEALWPIVVVGVMLIAHHIKPARTWTFWSGIAASTVWGGFGLVIFVPAVFYARSLLVEEIWLAALTLVPAVVSLVSFFKRRRETTEVVAMAS